MQNISASQLHNINGAGLVATVIQGFYTVLGGVIGSAAGPAGTVIGGTLGAGIGYNVGQSIERAL